MGRMVYAGLLLEFSLTSIHPRLVANSNHDQCTEDSLPGQNSTRPSVVLTTQAEPPPPRCQSTFKGRKMWMKRLIRKH